VSRSADPLTGQSSCVIAAYDKLQFRKNALAYTKTGSLYPMVEINSKHGLLVGVGSGGRFRLPTGDILWRVDDRPLRELHAADNPGLNSTQFYVPKTGNEETDRKVAEAMASTSKLVASMSSTSTLASGQLAAEMLREMLGGQSLLFRAAAAAPAFGVPTGNERDVGQITLNGGIVERRPFPLDASFREGIRACGISL